MLHIPESADRAVLLIRHSIAVSGGDDEARTLEFEGLALCERVRDFYIKRLHQLMTRFGKGLEYWSSHATRAIMTSWELFGPEHINRSMQLNNLGSITRIHGGAWYKAGKTARKTDVELIREVIEHPALQDDQPFNDGATNYLQFMRERDRKLVVAVGHEPNLSFVAKPWLPTEQLGLKECEGVVFYFDAKGEIFSAEKLVPE